MLGAMFADLLPRQPSKAYDAAFVAEVRVRKPRARDRRLERIILACWALIAVKHVAVIWACHHWPVPFHPLWINAPTWMLGVVATLAYYLAED